MPKSTQFTRKLILSAARELVRAEGWEALSARGIADRLGASTAPVYTAFSSMASLEEALLQELLLELDAAVEGPYTTSRFLNQGVGFASFARDEPVLFLYLYRKDVSGGGFLDAYQAELRSRLSEDALLSLLSAESAERLACGMWTYTIGLAFALAHGRRPDGSTEAIARELRAVGSSMIYAELSGVADYGSPEAREAWIRLARESGLSIPLEPVLINSEARSSKDFQAKEHA